MTRKRDKLYTHQSAETGSFRFDAPVAEVFDDMIARSVPGYAQILNLLPTLTRQFCFPHHHYYDLGCSTGAGLIAMAQGLCSVPAQLIGVDSSAAMLEHAQTNLNNITLDHEHRFSLRHSDVLEMQYHTAGMVLMNFTLQFIAPELRSSLLESIFTALRPGGLLVLSEKLQPEDPQANELLTRIHHQFKADQGYSEMEISAKRDAIENVLIPESLESHVTRLKNTGFSLITPWIRNLQFVSLLAIK